MERISFVFYKSFYEAINELDPEDREACYTALMRYVFEGEEPKMKGVTKAIFNLIKPQIDANNVRFENGCKGGRPPKENTEKKTEQKPNQNQNETKDKPNSNLMSYELGVMSNELGVMSNEYISYYGANTAPEEDGEKKSAESDPVEETFEKFRKMRKRIGRPLNEDSEKIIRDKLKQYSEGSSSKAIKILEKAIEGGHVTIVPLKEEAAKATKVANFAQHDYDFAELTRRAKA